jgi:hypothetical protein
LGNFERISFNLGPTLMRWMSSKYPSTLARIINQDRKNLAAYGVGNAMAQSYNHTILPLARHHDKVTQVHWGIADFEYRFGHRPKGMWLPETAIDLKTLQVLADYGIEFTILAPWQAETNNLDTTRVYWVSLARGMRMAVIFYDADLSSRISFDPGATANADYFLQEILVPKFDRALYPGGETRIVTIASDGELYGHHQPFRDQFLGYLLGKAIRGWDIEPTFPAYWIKKNPPQETIRIRDLTSWSCLHGVKRWMTACDCTPNSNWKLPLRRALNKLAAALDKEYLGILSPLMNDPWQLRHRYIYVLCEQVGLDELVGSMVHQKIEPELLRKIQVILAAQYERQRMFTSGGWFFDDFDRIEPRNNVAYAAQAVYFTYLATGVDLSGQAKEWLRPVVSWRTGLSAEIVFHEHYERTRNNPQIHSWALNQSSMAFNSFMAW